MLNSMKHGHLANDILPPQSRWIQRCGNAMLEHLFANGYELIYPCLLERYESLKKSGSKDLLKQVSVMTDPVSGELVCIRPDMTPQIARIDRSLSEQGSLKRFCYSGPVCLSRPKESEAMSEQWQIGAEILGCTMPLADLESVQLSIECMSIATDTHINMELAHPGLVRSILKALLTVHQQRKVEDIFIRKSLPDLCALKDHINDAKKMRVLFLLIEGHGSWRDFKALSQKLSEALIEQGVDEIEDSIRMALSDLSQLGDRVYDWLPESIQLGFDLSDKISYEYHTGVVFGMYSALDGTQLLRGGRYRRSLTDTQSGGSATGMSMDLRIIYHHTSQGKQASLCCDKTIGIDARCFLKRDPSLLRRMQELRLEGFRIVRMYQNKDCAAVSYRLERTDKGEWDVTKVKSGQ